MNKLISSLSIDNRLLVFNYIPIYKKKHVNKKCYSQHLDLYFPEKYQDWIDIRDIFKNNHEFISYLNNYIDIKNYTKIIHNIYSEIKEKNLNILFTDGISNDNVLELYSIISRNMDIDLMTFIYLFPIKNKIIMMLSNIFNKQKMYLYLIHPEERNQIPKKYLDTKYYQFMFILSSFNTEIKNIDTLNFYLFTKKINLILYTTSFIIGNNFDPVYRLIRKIQALNSINLKEKITFQIIRLLFSNDTVSVLKLSIFFFFYTILLIILRFVIFVENNMKYLFISLLIYSPTILFFLDLYLKKKLYIFDDNFYLQ